MKHLEKITISNIRRFGENVEINIGKGATIFLAPNGTGKTAIFEAIELALTGKVKRLLFPPEPLIRDLQLEASIKLDFEDGKFCQAIFKKGSVPELDGDHAELFGKVEEQDLPFLLQLTHFLNQQGNNWFVNSHGIDAGSQLDHLSIGREATEVNQLIPSAKRAAGNELSIAQRAFEEAEEKWKQWLVLIDRRKHANIGLLTELTPREELLNQMNTIAVQFRNVPIGSDSKLIELKVLNAELVSVCNIRLETLSKQFVELRSYVSLVPEYESLNISLKASKTLVSTKKEQLKTKENELLLFSKLIEGTEKEYSDLQKKVVNNQHRINLFNQQQLLTTQIKFLELKAKTLNYEVSQTSTQQKTAKSDLITAQNVKNVHQLFRKRLDNVNNESRRIERLRSELSRWVESDKVLQDLIKIKIPQVRNELNLLERSREQANKEQLETTDQFEKSQLGYQALSQTVDIINNAVGTIIAEYPKDRGDCPVCGADYQANDLQRKMAESASKIHPGLKALSDLIEINRNNVQKSYTKTKDIESKLTSKKQELSKFEGQRTSVLSDIDEIRSLSFNSNENIGEARVWLDKIFEDNNANLSKLNLEKDQAPLEISDEQIILLTENSLKLDELVLKYLDDLNKISIDLTNLRSSVQANTDSLITNQTIDQLNTELKKSEDGLSALNAKIIEQKNSLDSLRSGISMLKDEIVREEINLSQITTRLSEYRSKWIDAKLSGEPQIDVLNQGILNIEERIKIGQEFITKLEEISRELSRWQVVENDQKVELEINAIRGEFAEEVYHEILEAELQRLKDSLKAVSQNMEILSVFSECLSRELDVVHERIVSINPLWKKLLKRIIIDPRFSQTQLDSFSYYKKQHANVNVKLHNNDVLVSQVASEAQITDLQLTFMLAMAQKYQWTSWRSLLLDDPTQHHDLVHASAVFDLLRDYIADFDFQILMATHDPIQARFFKRKLENDGITVNICTLFATEDGVEAKMGV